MRYLMAVTLAASTTLAGAAFSTTASAQGGSYAASCRNISNQGGYVTAECADGSGRFRQTTIQSSACRGDIGNNNGVLSCNGAAGTAGGYVGEGGRGGGNGGRGGNDYAGGRDRDRDRGGNNAAGAAVAGAVVGALLGGNLYQQGYSYPTYGDARYGDPRYDPRFADGGWGYGSRGQWVPIERRADWLDRRIDRGQQNGNLGRREAQDLRYQLNNLVNLERSYSRNGLNNRERAELDRRFDDLASRIRFESRDDNNRPGGGYGGGYNR